MQASKCIRATLWGLTERKKALLSSLSESWKAMVKEKRTYAELRETHPEVVSFYARNASYHGKSPNDPIYLTNYDFRLIDTGNPFARWFVRIPVKKGVPVFAPLRMPKGDEAILSRFTIHDSRLVVKDGRFCLHLSVSKEVSYAQASAVLSVDLGERFMATTVLIAGACKTTPRFYGKEVRGLRRHYAWLRARLLERGLTRVVRRIKDRERRKVDAILHKISKDIVTEAKANNAAILLGDLKGIGRKKRGRRLNRIVANMPFYRLTNYIIYKAALEGVPTVIGSEAYSSKLCHNCNSEGRRPYQGLFICDKCGHQYNADYNGAMNTGKRLSGYILGSGVIGFSPISEMPLTISQGVLGYHNSNVESETWEWGIEGP
ncbi:MAG: transposase [Thaumarchaeota archaeon]|nr:transposase [Nitrososphaerota archaeon]